MAAKRVKIKNHVVPKGLLKNWINKSNGVKGHHYFDLKDFTQKFEVGGNAKFAIFNYVYVPKGRSGKRDDGLEDWFAVDENGLAPFAKAAFDGTPTEFQEERLAKQALRACIALGFRSTYQLYHSIIISLENEAVRGDLSPHEFAIQNATRMIGRKFEQFLNWNFLVLYNLPGELLINEQPFFDWTIREEPQDLVTMPLAPTALLIASPPSEERPNQFSLAWKDGSDNKSIIDRLNRLAIATARDWIVARTANQISQILPELSEEKVESRKNGDRTIATW